MARHSYLGIVLVLCLAAEPARPDAVIDLTTDIAAVQPGGGFARNQNVVIPIHVTGGGAFEEVDWFMQLDHGDTGSASGPYFQGIDLLQSPAGSGYTQSPIFAANNGGDAPWIAHQSLYDSTITDSGTVTADGVLGYVTINTGDRAGSYALKMTDLEGDLAGLETSLGGGPLTILNGQINVVPEPRTVIELLGLLSTSGLGVWYWRRRSRQPPAEPPREPFFEE